MFQALICPSSGVCNCVVELPHWLCWLRLIWPTYANLRSLKIQFQEHIRYVRSNNPQSPFASHILQNQHEYGHMNNILTLLKPLSSPNTLIPYEQYYIQTLCRTDKLIPEQYPGETNLLFQTVINPQPLHTT